MNRFFAKYGKPVLFSIVVIICVSFLVHLLSLGSGYNENIDAQAAERAGDYALEQALYTERQFNALKTRGEFYAARLSACRTESEISELLHGVDDNLTATEREVFKDIFYIKNGVLMSKDGTPAGEYPEITALSGVTQTQVSRLFQFENRLMSFAVVSPVDSPYMSEVVLLYARTAISITDFMYDEENRLIDSVANAACLLLCKHDGVILERQINDTDRINLGSATVQEGLFRTLADNNGEYDRMLALITGKEGGTEITTLGSEKYVLTVTPPGAGNGNMFLVGLYSTETLCGSGYSIMNTIWGTLLLLCGIILLFVVLFVVDRVHVRRQVRQITLLDEDLDCYTQLGFEKEADELLDRYRTSRFAVLILQISNFSYIGERFGESKSKEVLRFTRNICANAMMLGETYGYMKDGAFLLLLHYKDRKALAGRLNGLHAQILQYAGFPDGEYKISVSYSVYEVERDKRQSAARMVEKAKMVENNATVQRGTVAINFYGDMLRENYLRRAEIEGRMESALEHNEFHLFYQPKYNLKKGMLDGSEILVRWFDIKIDSYRKPADFLPVFEENGFINKLDRFVFYRACENIAETVRQKKTVFPVSVNVSRVTAIQSDFVDYYIRIKQKFNIIDGFVTLEFTESFAYENYEYLSGVLDRLHAAGFLCSLDDFGTGYSSFGVLKSLDMDEIKIDKSLLDKSEHPERDEILLQSIIGMIRKLGIKITQEGVEDKAEFEMLEQMGCDVIQGYYFAKPMKYVDYREFVATNFDNIR